MEFLIPYLNTIAAGLCIILILLAYYHVRIKDFKVARRPKPPKPSGAWPIIGHLPVLTGSQLPHVALGALADKYGPIFTVQLGLHEALVVSSWEIAKELFTKHDVDVSTRPKITAAKHLGFDSTMFGFAPYDAYWREMRKIVSLELLSARKIELLKHVRISEVETSLKELHQLCDEKKNQSGHALVNLQQCFFDLTLNVILRMVVGKRFSSSSVTEEKFRCQKALKEFFHLFGVFLVRDAIPFLGWLDVGGHEKAMKRTAKEMENICVEWLEEHRRKRDTCKGEIKEQDFMDTMLSIIGDHTSFFGHDSEKIVKSTCLNMIAGAADTTAITLTWAVSLLLNNRHVLEKAQEELDLCVGKTRLLKESDISNLTYLQAIVKETLRLYPAAPLPGPRAFSQDCDVCGYHVKKGTRLIINVWKIHRDPQIWEKPLEFNPDRFLSSDKDVDSRGQSFEFIPFGGGRRACPGAAFAQQMVHITLGRFLQAFELSTPSSAPIDMTESLGLSNMKVVPLEVYASPRLPPQLYG